MKTKLTIYKIETNYQNLPTNTRAFAQYTVKVGDNIGKQISQLVLNSLTTVLPNFLTMMEFKTIEITTYKEEYYSLELPRITVIFDDDAKIHFLPVLDIIE